MVALCLSKASGAAGTLFEQGNGQTKVGVGAHCHISFTQTDDIFYFSVTVVSSPAGLQLFVACAVPMEGYLG